MCISRAEVSLCRPVIGDLLQEEGVAEELTVSGVTTA